jgi:hypothetical protein
LIVTQESERTHRWLSFLLEENADFFDRVKQWTTRVIAHPLWQDRLKSIRPRDVPLSIRKPLFPDLCPLQSAVAAITNN